MLQQVPQAITTTELQRNPKKLEESMAKGIQVVVIRESRQLGVFTPISEYNEFVREFRENLEELKEVRKDLAKHTGAFNLGKGYSPKKMKKLYQNSYEMLS